MLITLIAAMSRDRVIGFESEMPWRLPADLKHFKQTTLGKPIVMGRKTFESIGSRPLPKRTNIVVTRQPDYRADGCLVAGSVGHAVEMAAPCEEVMICGGSGIYEALLARADRMILTFIDAEFEGDTFFPVYDETQWREVSRESHEPDEKNHYRYSFVELERVR